MLSIKRWPRTKNKLHKVDIEVLYCRTVYSWVYGHCNPGTSNGTRTFRHWVFDWLDSSVDSDDYWYGDSSVYFHPTNEQATFRRLQFDNGQANNLQHHWVYFHTSDTCVILYKWTDTMLCDWRTERTWICFHSLDGTAIFGGVKFGFWQLERKRIAELEEEKLSNEPRLE